jgi:hypothetical protein
VTWRLLSSPPLAPGSTATPPTTTSCACPRWNPRFSGEFPPFSLSLVRSRSSG